MHGNRNIKSSFTNLVVPRSLTINAINPYTSYLDNICDTTYHSIFGLTIASSIGITLILERTFNNQRNNMTNIYRNNHASYSQYFDIRSFLLNQVKQAVTVKSIYWISMSTEPSIIDQLAVVLTSPGRDEIRTFMFLEESRNNANYIKWKIKLIKSIPIGREIYSLISSSSITNTNNFLYICTDKFLKSYSLTSYQNNNIHENSCFNNNKDFMTHIPIGSPITSLSQQSDSTILIGGQRNGGIILLDTRMNQIALHVAHMPSCIDQVGSLNREGTTALALDIAGKLSIFDIRRGYGHNTNTNNNPSSNSGAKTNKTTIKNNECLSICQTNQCHDPSLSSSSSSVMMPRSPSQQQIIGNRKFWLPSTDNPEFVITPQIQTKASSSSSSLPSSHSVLSVYSLKESNTMLHSLQLPFEQFCTYTNNRTDIDMSRVRLLSSSLRFTYGYETDFSKKQRSSLFDYEHENMTYNSEYHDMYNNSYDGLYGMIDSKLVFQGRFNVF